MSFRPRLGLACARACAFLRGGWVGSARRSLWPGSNKGETGPGGPDRQGPGGQGLDRQGLDRQVLHRQGPDRPALDRQG